MASAGGSGSSSSNSSFSSGKFGQDVWKGQSPYLQGLYGQAASLFGSTLPGLQSQVPGAIDYASKVSGAALPTWSSELQGGTFKDVNAGDISSKLTGQIGEPGTNTILSGLKPVDVTNPFGAGPTDTQRLYAGIMGGQGNTYADALKNKMQEDANLATNNMLNTLDLRASQAGMGGSSRQGIAQAQGMADINKNLQRNLTDVGYNTFDKDLANKLDIARAADANRLGSYQAGLNYNRDLANSMNTMLSDRYGYNASINDTLSGLLSGRAGTISGALAGSSGMTDLGTGGMRAFNPLWDSASRYADIIGGPTILGSGRTTSMGQGSSKGGGGGVSVGSVKS